MSPRSLAKQLNIGNTASLERRIKRELEEQGKIPERRSLNNPFRPRFFICWITLHLLKFQSAVIGKKNHRCTHQLQLSSLLRF